MPKSLPAFTILLILWSSLPTSAQQQDSTDRKSAGQKPAVATSSKSKRPAAPVKVDSGSRNSPLKLSAEQQEAALKFAADHHPELAKLLGQLRRKSPAAFARGIREVHAASQRIQRMSERAPNRVETELRRWKTDSEIRLMTARWAISQDPVLEKKIRDLLRERQEARLKEMKAERDRLAKRLQLLDEQIGMGTAELDEFLEREFNRLSRQALSAASQQRSKRSGSRPRPAAAKPAATKKKPRE